MRIWQQSEEAITVAEWAAQRRAAEEALDYGAGRHTCSNTWSIEQMQTVSVTQALGTYARANRARIQAGVARRKAEERQGKSGTVCNTSSASVIQVGESSDSAAPDEEESEEGPTVTAQKKKRAREIQTHAQQHITTTAHENSIAQAGSCDRDSTDAAGSSDAGRVTARRKAQQMPAQINSSASAADGRSDTHADFITDAHTARAEAPSRKRAVRSATAQQTSKATEDEQKRLEKLAIARAAKVAKIAGSRRSRSPSEQRQGQPNRKRRRNLTQVAQIEMGQVAVHRVVGDTYDIHDRDMRRKRRRILTRRETAENAQSAE